MTCADCGSDCGDKGVLRTGERLGPLVVLFPPKVLCPACCESAARLGLRCERTGQKMSLRQLLETVP